MKDKALVGPDGTTFYVSASRNKRVRPFVVKFYKNWPRMNDPDVIEFKTFDNALSYFIRHDMDSRMVVERRTVYDISVQKGEKLFNHKQTDKEMTYEN